MVEVSINGLSSTNLWSNDPSTTNLFLTYVPSYTLTGSVTVPKVAIPVTLSTVVVIFSGIENVYVVSS